MNILTKSGLRFSVVRKAGAWRLLYRRAGRVFELGSDTSLSRMVERLENIGCRVEY